MRKLIEVQEFKDHYGDLAKAISKGTDLGALEVAGVMRKHVNSVSSVKLWPLWDIAIRIVTPGMLIIIVGGALFNEFSSRYEGYSVKALLVIGGGILFGTRLASFILSHFKWDPARLSERHHEPEEDDLLV